MAKAQKNTREEIIFTPEELATLHGKVPLNFDELSIDDDGTLKCNCMYCEVRRKEFPLEDNIQADQEWRDEVAPQVRRMIDAVAKGEDPMPIAKEIAGPAQSDEQMALNISEILDRVTRARESARSGESRAEKLREAQKRNPEAMKELLHELAGNGPDSFKARSARLDALVQSGDTLGAARLAKQMREEIETRAGIRTPDADSERGFDPRKELARMRENVDAANAAIEAIDLGPDYIFGGDLPPLPDDLTEFKRVDGTIVDLSQVVTKSELIEFETPTYLTVLKDTREIAQEFLDKGNIVEARKAANPQSASVSYVTNAVAGFLHEIAMSIAKAKGGPAYDKPDGRVDPDAPEVILSPDDIFVGIGIGLGLFISTGMTDGNKVREAQLRLQAAKHILSYLVNDPLEDDNPLVVIRDMIAIGRDPLAILKKDRPAGEA